MQAPVTENSKSPRRKPLLGLFAGAALALIGLAVLELALRLLGAAPPPERAVLEDAEVPGTVRVRALGISADTPHVTPPFARERAANSIRILLLGESAAAGFPYAPASTPARFLEYRLRELLPGREVDVVDCAIAGINSDWLAAVAERALAARPDVVVLYAGNNEFLHSFVEWRRQQESPLRAVLGELALARVVRAGLGRGSAALPPSREPLNAELDVEPAIGDLGARILESFGQNLDRMLSAARGSGASALVIAPVAGERGVPPLVSTHSRDLSPAERERFAAEFRAGTAALRGGDAAAARDRFLACAALDGDVAAVEYRLGEVALATGAVGAADRHFARALDLDDQPIRVHAKLRSELSAAAARAGVPFVDARAWFAARGEPAPLIDHVHFTIAGQYQLASLVLEALEAARLLGDVGPLDRGRDPPYAAALQALGIDASAALLPLVQLGFVDLLLSRQYPGFAAEYRARARLGFERVLRENPGLPRAELGIAFVLAAEGRGGEALAAFERACSLAPAVAAELAATVERWPALQQILAESGLELAAGSIARRSRE